MSNNNPLSDKETTSQTIGCLIILAIISLSIGMGYLTEPGWGWLTLGLGCLLLAVVGKITESE